MIRDINKSARLFHAKWTAPASEVQDTTLRSKECRAFRNEVVIRLQQSRVDG